MEWKVLPFVKHDDDVSEYIDLGSVSFCEA
jgi:hypothetical protein